MGQLIFKCDIIILIKHTEDWQLIPQQNQSQINKYNIRQNIKRVIYDYKIVDKVMINNNIRKNMKTCILGHFL